MTNLLKFKILKTMYFNKKKPSVKKSVFSIVFIIECLFGLRNLKF